MKRGRHEAYIIDEVNRVMRCSVDNAMLNFAAYGHPWGECDKCDRLYSAETRRQVTRADIARVSTTVLVETGDHLPPDIGDML